MRVKFKKISIQNFYSYGTLQELNFEQFNSTVVLIDGVDKDTEGSKIGSGKSSLMAALTFALFGETVSNLKANEIVNYIKGKEALVVLEFDIGNSSYKIERGRKPKILNIYNMVDSEWVNISKADDRDNDLMIEKMIHMNFETFLQTSLFSVASESNKPFLNMSPVHQKKVLENIFNFDAFNVILSDIKDRVRDEQIKLVELESNAKEIAISNEQINNQIERLEDAAIKFEENRKKQIKSLKNKIAFYKTIDITAELEKYSFKDELREYKSQVSEQISELQSELNGIKTDVSKIEREIEIMDEKLLAGHKSYESLLENKCPTCSQEWIDPNAVKTASNSIKKLQENIASYNGSLTVLKKSEKKLKKSISEKREILDSIKDALNEIECSIEKKELDNLEIILSNLDKDLNSIKNQENHFIVEIEANMGLIRDINMADIDEVSHFVNKLKSFIKLSEDPKTRGKFLRKFIKQTNEILRSFKKLIPDYNIHIQFNPDFTIRVMKLGKEVSSGSLSNGEKRIGNIMIMMALMKVFKLKNNVEFNAMFMDEVLDSGINGALLESVYSFIKNVAKEEKMRIFLISHREEIKEKVKEVILVTKSRGISTIEVMR